MTTFGKILVIALYPLVIATGVVRRLQGRDPLRLKEPPPRASCWMACPPSPPARSYFSEAGEPGTDGSHGWAARVLAGAARLLARRHRAGQPSQRPSAMPTEVPDEVYTLW